MANHPLTDLQALMDWLVATYPNINNGGSGGGSGTVTPDDIQDISSTVLQLLKAPNPAEIRAIINAAPVYSQMPLSAAQAGSDTSAVYVISPARLRAAILAVTADVPVLATSNDMNGDNQFSFIRKISGTGVQNFTIANMVDNQTYKIIVKNTGTGTIQVNVTGFPFYENVNNNVASGFSAIIEVTNYAWMEGTTRVEEKIAVLSVRRV